MSVKLLPAKEKKKKKTTKYKINKKQKKTALITNYNKNYTKKT